MDLGFVLLAEGDWPKTKLQLQPKLCHQPSAALLLLLCP
jgi:hypothetical protein